MGEQNSEVLGKLQKYATKSDGDVSTNALDADGDGEKKEPVMEEAARQEASNELVSL